MSESETIYGALLLGTLDHIIFSCDAIFSSDPSKVKVHSERGGEKAGFGGPALNHNHLRHEDVSFSYR